MTSWSETRQAITLEGATHRGDTWTTDELEFVATFAGEPDTDIALALDRTLYAVWAMKHALRVGRPVAALAPRTRVQVRSDRGYTFIGDDVPEGW